MRKIRIRTAVNEDVHMIRGRFCFFRSPLSFCCYIVDGLLIDTGPVRARSELLPYLTDKNPRQIVLTHFHEDHAGNADFWAAYFRIPLYRSPETKSEFDRLEMPAYRRIIWGNKRGEMGGVDVPEWLETPNHRFRIVRTPGHSPDHICLLEEEKKWLFAGDLFLGTRLDYGMKGESVPRMIDSIKRILTFPVETVFCGHAGIVEDGRFKLEKKLRFLEGLQEKTLEFHERGLDEAEIAKRLLPSKQWVSLFTGGEMSPVHLVHSIVRERMNGR
ncbi:MBL fold metallo-hydrolase [Thermoactinomyces sp. CICC 10522]|uniref:MBL fold metallo-hydrolase n=1 Tax=Thermoactinomyces sp. CICC 10522 TaxID=2767427 RepID=UPI0018DB342C|nr:MBL fold metallo-hydrolase [Thermoactinomyces sp. CICC 10522]MBH8604557.1 MBL fold metallo-hydrolase [Thermoactinomyces sp. CICC 10522]